MINLQLSHKQTYPITLTTSTITKSLNLIYFLDDIRRAFFTLLPEKITIVVNFVIIITFIATT